MAIVIRFFRRLCCCLALVFLSFIALPGFVYANDVSLPFSSSTFPSSIVYYSSQAGSSRTVMSFNNFSFTPANSVNVASQFFNDGFCVWRYSNFVGSIYRFDSFRVPISFSVSDLPFETDNLSVLYEPDLTFFVDGSEYLRLPAIFSGTITFNFSDGSSESFGIGSNTGTLDFSINKDNRTNLFDFTSDNAFNLNSKDYASLDGSLSFSGGSVDAPVSGQVSGTATLPDELRADIYAGGTANFGSRGWNAKIRSQGVPGESSGNNFQIENKIQLSSGTSGNTGNYFNIFATRLAFEVLDGTINMSNARITFAAETALTLVAELVNAKVDSLTVTQAKARAVGTLVAPNSSVQALTTIVPHNPAVYITGFSFSGSLLVGTYLLPPFQLPETFKSPALCYFGLRSYFSYNTDKSIGNAILSRLDKIYYALRFDLPLQLRHLLIPTTEEVKDVITDAVEDIENNAGGLGEALGVVNGEIKEIQNAIGSTSKTPVVLPAFDIEIFGRQVKLWPDVDLAPYLDNELVRLIMTPGELLIEYLLAKFLINQIWVAYMCLTSGSSYIGFLRMLRGE